MFSRYIGVTCYSKYNSVKSFLKLLFNGSEDSFVRILCVGSMTGYDMAVHTPWQCVKMQCGKEQKKALPTGIEPVTFRLTAERSTY